MDKGSHDSKQFFQMMEKFQKFVGYTLKLFHIVRNPYDNIATLYLYSISKETRKEAFKNNRTFEASEGLKNSAINHIASFKKIQRHIDYFGERLITLYNEDLISNPKLFLKRMCNHMEIYCNEYYRDKAYDKVFSSATKSRHSVEWKKDVKKMVDTAIKRYSFLNRYSFEN
ncbi:hypothetical protein LOD99_5685 [Oopsacas minuta]|uniref:Uncharacterized protein n=1 Tax=Oopsacas minuta TaxID=111878 RepID=A0AAV7JQY5_9METZ|nr:hypothetical protein LOD99_5685 [Oopsacas minuta]